MTKLYRGMTKLYRGMTKLYRGMTKLYRGMTKLKKTFVRRYNFILVQLYYKDKTKVFR
jgi:hypothetical protein